MDLDAQPTLTDGQPQTSPLFRLPLELKSLIYEYLFFDMRGKYTIMPEAYDQPDTNVSENMNEDYSPSSYIEETHDYHPDEPILNPTWTNEDMTAILLTCHQIADEVTDTWRALPQSYQSVRDVTVYRQSSRIGLDVYSTFDVLAPQVWLALRDLTITIAAFARSTTQPAYRFRVNEQEMQRIEAFARLLGSSNNLLRLHIVPAQLLLGESFCYQGFRSRVPERYEKWIVVDLLRLLKPFACCLPASVKLTTQGDWLGWHKSIWEVPSTYPSPEVPSTNQYKELAQLCEDSLVAMHAALAGKPFLLDDDNEDEWEVPNITDIEGHSYMI